MAGVIAYRLWSALTSGSITGPQLEAKLADSATQIAFSGLVASRAWFRAIGASATAMVIIAASNTAVALITGSSEAVGQAVRYAPSALALVASEGFSARCASYPSDRSRVAAALSASYSKWRRHIYKASGTYTAPPGGIYAYAVAAVGGGGGGQRFPTAAGGGAGQTKTTGTVLAAPADWLSPISVVVGAGSAGESGAAGGTSSFGSFCSAVGGGLTYGGASGTPSGAFAEISNRQVDDAMWLMPAINVSGPNAGGGTNPGGGARGGAGLAAGLYMADSGAGGVTSGGMAGGAAPNGGGGTGGDGGGGGGKYGAGGGGTGTVNPAGSGGPGFVVLYVIEN